MRFWKTILVVDKHRLSKNHFLFRVKKLNRYAGCAPSDARLLQRTPELLLRQLDNGDDWNSVHPWERDGRQVSNATAFAYSNSKYESYYPFFVPLHYQRLFVMIFYWSSGPLLWKKKPKHFRSQRVIWWGSVSWVFFCGEFRFYGSFCPSVLNMEICKSMEFAPIFFCPVIVYAYQSHP